MISSFVAELQNIKNKLCHHSGKTEREELPLAVSNDDEGRRSGMSFSSLSLVVFSFRVLSCRCFTTLLFNPKNIP